MIETATVAELRAAVASLRGEGRRIAFVPTMGNLHAGHRRLMDEARRRADAVAVSIYVNPLQFGPREDFAAYPRTPEADRTVLRAADVDLLFAPDERTVYPRGRERQTQVEVPQLGDILCGAFRPGHFRGVTTVVARLLHLVAPDIAVFGRKDYQQWLIIRHMTADLGLSIEIVGVDTAREPDGLALSSRNRYLTAEERRIAPQLYAALARLRERVEAGAAPAEAERAAGAELTDAGFRVDYISVRRAEDLAEPGPHDRRLVALAAAWLGRTRLIDNVELERAV